jgi:hypothetical protein
MLSTASKKVARQAHCKPQFKGTFEQHAIPHLAHRLLGPGGQSHKTNQQNNIHIGCQCIKKGLTLPTDFMVMAENQ